MTAWYDDDALWEALAPALFTDARLASAAADVDAIVRLLGLEPGMQVLDLCCGPGRHAVELARRGLRVTGVDRTASYLARARAAADAAGVELELIEEDMRAFARPRGFDAVVNLYTSFGYFEDDADNQRVLENVARCLRPGRAAVLELRGKEQVALSWRGGRWWRDDGGVLVCEEQTVDDGWDRLRTRWIIVSGGVRRDVVGVQRLYSATELRAMLAAAGFASVDIHGTLAGGPYDVRATRMVAVARCE